MTAKLVGMGALQSRFNKYVKQVEKQIVDVRKEVAREFVKALLDNTPVWSGRTVRSISVGNTVSGANAGEAHPDRGDRLKDGKWKNHKDDWGDTKKMPLGPEPNRGAAEAIVFASVESTRYDLGSKVFISSNSYNWGDVDKATYRPDARNSAVVSEIALAQVKAKFGKIIR